MVKENLVLGKANKKGVSVLIGYILLVVFAVVMAAIVYSWLVTYVPRAPLECADGVSLFVKQSGFDNTTSQLVVTLRNNGRFAVAGYFIHATNSSEQTLATLDLSKYLNETGSGQKLGSSVIFSSSQGNSLQPGQEVTNIFTLPPEMGTPYSLTIIPTAYGEQNNRERFLSCSNAEVQQKVGEKVECVPSCSGKVCGSDGCGGECTPGCDNGYFCDGSGQCISNACTPAADPTLAGICGSFACGTGTNGTCGQVSCGTCSTGYTCNTAVGQCVADCGNGVVNSGEACDDNNTVSGDGCSSTCQIESGYSCTGTSCTLNCGNGVIDSGEQCDGTNLSGNTCQSFGYSGGTLGCSSSCTYIYSQCTTGGGAPSCLSYCQTLGLGYTSSNCPANSGQCNSQNGDVRGTSSGQGGYDQCTNSGATGSYVCCCKPATF